MLSFVKKMDKEARTAMFLNAVASNISLEGHVVIAERLYKEAAKIKQARKNLGTKSTLRPIQLA